MLERDWLVGGWLRDTEWWCCAQKRCWVVVLWSERCRVMALWWTETH